jgi:TonB family protein
MVYGLIAFGLLMRLGWRVYRIHQLIRRSIRQSYSRYTLVLPAATNIATFSFFRYIVLNPADAGNSLVLRHEQVHARQWHSADVMGLAIVRALAWGCPVLWLFNRALRQVHEFLADRYALEQVTQPTEYARFLVDYAFGLRPEPLTNGFFNPTLLKQRIQMLHRQATTRWALGKYLLLLPLSLLLVAMTSVPHELEALVQQATDQRIVVKGRVTNTVDGKALPGANIYVKGKQSGTSTDEKGMYVITVAADESLVFSYNGFQADIVALGGLANKLKKGVLVLNARLQPTLENELPAMGATADYKAVKPNPAMPLTTVPQSVLKNGETYTATSEPASIPTGISGLMNYIARNLKYPAKAKAAGIEGDVYVLFTIAPSGKVTDVEVNKAIDSPGGGCREEAVRVVSEMPDWRPAKQQGRPVAARYQLPIRFALDHTVMTPKTPQAVPADTLPKSGKLWAPSGDYPSYSTNKDRYSLPLPDSLRLFPNPKANIRISKLSLADPLYVIDGVILEKGKLDDVLKPDQIQHINVLKDGAATATYGEKGKNGVIEITTKKP